MENMFASFISIESNCTNCNYIFSSKIALNKYLKAYK